MKIENICIITDFDHTITAHTSKSTWDVLEMSKSIPQKCREECQKNRQYYLPKEKDYKISFAKKSEYMKEWLEKNLDIFVKCHITEEDIKEISTAKDCMSLRKEAKSFFEYASENNIPIIIVSAGIADIIENFLFANNLFTKNVHVISNKLKYEDGRLIGLENESIHSLNKSKVKFPSSVKSTIEKKEKIYLFGDNVEDTLLTPKDKETQTFKIGFLDRSAKLEEFQKAFDKVIKNGTFKDVLRIIKNNE